MQCYFSFYLPLPFNMPTGDILVSNWLLPILIYFIQIKKYLSFLIGYCVFLRGTRGLIDWR